MKRLLFFFTTTLLLLSLAISAFAYDFSAVSNGKTLYYNITSSSSPYKVEVTYQVYGSSSNYSSLSGSLTIPSSVTYSGRTYSVTSIGEWAFSYCSGLTSVTIPNSVTSIGSCAFQGCSGLTTITIGNSVTSIGDDVFYDCSGLTSPVYNANCFAYFPCGYATTYTIPNGIQQIAGGAFSGCSGLTSVTIPNSVTSIGDYAFDLVKNIIYNGSATGSPWGALTINGFVDGYLVYSDNTKTNLTGCSSLATSVTIPNSVTSIGEWAFSYCSGLTTVTIPNSVTSIDERAFYSCSGLTTVNFNATNCTSMGSNVWSGCSSLSTLNIGENVTKIPDSAFSGCSGLTSVTIPNSVTSIGYDTFYDCSGLTRVVYTGSIAQWCGIRFDNQSAQPLSYAHNLYINSSLVTNLVIPNTVEEIKAYAFYDANSLTSVTIPNSVTSIGNSAFSGCSGLTAVNFNATNCTTMGSSSRPVFQGCNANATINIGTGVTVIPNYAFYGLIGSGTLTIPNSVTSIGNSAFSGCSGLTAVNFNATNCTTMGSYNSPAFSGCTSLATLNIGENVTNIPDFAFYGCSGLTAVTIPSSVTGVGVGAFSDCSGLITVNFNAINCTTMGRINGNNVYPVFYECPSLSTLNIGENVTNIPDIAFCSCSSLTGTLIIPSSVTNIGMGAFYGCSGLTSVTIGNSVTGIGDEAFGACSGLTSVTIPTSVTSIGEGAFYECSGLTSITIPSSVTSIGDEAFSGCSGLTTFNYNAENCTGTISENLFDSSNTLSKITIGENVATIPNNAFKNCTSLDSIISYASNPPVIYGGTFDSELSLNTPVVVPCGTVETYEDADFWYNFRHIQQRADCGATCTITVMSNNSAWGTVSGGGTYMVGETATLTATPNSGYSFGNWSDGSTENPHQIIVTQSDTYIATFVQGGSNNPTVYNSIEATACGSYTWNNQTYTESGEYQQMFTAANSADSIVTLTLTILPTPQPTITLYGELDACNPSSVAFATEQYQSYLWSNGATTMITSTSVSGYYYVEVTDENGCTGISEQVNIGVSNAITETPQISVVGMNSENHNVVAWSALDNENVNAYRIYRENNVANVYEPMATVEASQTTWTDETADPSARAYRYKLTAVDECGGESPMSDYHKTMHLTINQGIGSTWNLIWSHYEGFDFGTYRIYRGTNPSNMTMIGEVPSNLNSYTDNTATDNTGFYYQVEVVRNSRSRDAEISSRSNIVDNGIFPEYTITVMSANPNRGTVTGGGTYPEGTIVRIEANALDGFVFTSWSDDNTDNPRYITVTENATYIASFDPATGIEENATLEIALYPNPATDILNITSSETISEIEIVNVMGQVIKRIEVNSDNAVCDVENLKAGVYVVRIHGTVVSQRKFIKE